MATSRQIRVMISSRCNDAFPLASKTALSTTRRQLKKELEAVEVFGQRLFDVWINEDAAPASAVHDSWDECMRQVMACDILVVLSNGNAGWAESTGDIGICHAEAKEGLDRARGKVWLVSLGNIAPRPGKDGDRDRRFQDYMAGQSLFRGGEVTTVAALKKRVRDALHEALITLTQRGVTDAGSARFDMGRALDWSRLDFRQRKGEMEKVLRLAVADRPGARLATGGEVVAPIGGTEVLLALHAIPAALSVSAARELVGQPFLSDHEREAALGPDVGGPVHVIACHRGATESQATKLLGFPDATVVSAPFGIYVADNIQKVQFAFLANCRDADRTRLVAQRFFEWLRQTGEDKLLAARAASRARIVRAVAAEAP